MQATACYNTLNEDANFDGNHPHRQHHPHHQHQKLHREKVDEERTRRKKYKIRKNSN